MTKHNKKIDPVTKGMLSGMYEGRTEMVVKAVEGHAVEGMKKGKKFLEDFKEFAIRGNVMDMAIGVVIGTAFSTIVKSLVDNILMPLIGLVTAGNDFENLVIKFGTNSTIKYGLFIQSIVNFILIAFCIFLVIRVINKLWPKQDEAEEEEEAIITETDVLLDIKELLLQIKEENDNKGSENI
ncbi:MAG: large conductance mechanosensitive channel protein MscL [Clostridiales Family XIII bacterium]|jgi:large conductance mechanosensitive channel|nr:large conductance mechanosensitive channel protein MscL [Clostridiales Family XIII bacterium]